MNIIMLIWSRSANSFRGRRPVKLGSRLVLSKAGWQSAVAAWFGFTLPSAILMTIFGLGVTRFRTTIPAALLHGLMLVAVPVVARELDRAIEMRGTLPGLTPTRHVGRMVSATRQG